MQIKEAEAAYEDCFRKFPYDNSAVHWQLQAGKLLQSLGQLREAAKMFEEVAHKLPNDSEAVYRFGKALRDLQHFREARDVLAQFLQWKPVADPFFFAGLIELRSIVEGNPKEKETLERIDHILGRRLQRPQQSPSGDDLFNLSNKASNQSMTTLRSPETYRLTEEDLRKALQG